MFFSKYLEFCVFIVFILITQAVADWQLQNLNAKCMLCLCEAATGCATERRCHEEPGYCGPFKISQIYWIEAENVTISGDNPQRAGAYEDCSNNYFCAQNIIKSYLKKFGKDCNEDGVTNCYDYMMVNFNGGYGCTTPLEENTFGRMWLERYLTCMSED